MWLNEKENRAGKWQKLGKEMMDVLRPPWPQVSEVCGLRGAEAKPDPSHCPHSSLGTAALNTCRVLHEHWMSESSSPCSHSSAGRHREQCLGSEDSGSMSRVSPSPACPAQKPCRCKYVTSAPREGTWTNILVFGVSSLQSGFLEWIFLLLSCYFRLYLGKSQFSSI